MEENETIKVAFLREVKEETGLKLNKEDYEIYSVLKELDDECRYNAKKT